MIAEMIPGQWTAWCYWALHANFFANIFAVSQLWVSEFQTGYKEEIFYNEGGETLDQVVQGAGWCPIPGNIPGQVGWGSEQPGLVEDVPAHDRGGGLDGL